MSKLALTLNPRIVEGGGPITSDVYKSHATQLWQKGALLKLASGLLAVVVDTSSAGAEIDTDDTGTANVKMFVALEDHLAAGTVFVAVQEITRDTVIEAQVCNSGSGAALSSTAVVGQVYVGYAVDLSAQTPAVVADGAGKWGIDIDQAGDGKSAFMCVNISDVYNPFSQNLASDYGKIWVKVLASILA